MAFDPNEPRDERGRWTDAGDAIQKAAGNRDIGIAFAPYRAKSVETTQQDEQIRNGEDYKLYQQTVNDAAKSLGIEILNTANTWGGYVDSETGKPVQEVSNLINVNGSHDQAVLLAAIIGSAAPEMQDSVLVGTHDENGSGTEYTIKTGSFEKSLKAIDHMKANGIQYYTINKNSGDITLLDLDNSNTRNTIKFVGDLKKNNLYESAQSSSIEAEFVGQGDYRQIIGAGRDQASAKNGFNIDAFIEKTKTAYSKIKSP